MQTDRLNQTIRLHDGRVLGFAECGDPEGEVFFHFHGLYSSRLEVALLDDEMHRAGIRIIGVDRPGVGLSSYHKKRTISDFVSDIEVLADRLGIDSFSILAVSAGTAYALAACFYIPQRIKFCGLVSTLPPLYEIYAEHMPSELRSFIKISRKVPWLLRPTLWYLHGRLVQKRGSNEKLIANITLFYLDESDRKLIDDEKRRKFLVEIFTEGYRQGVRGVADEVRLLFGKPWGFSLSEITFAPIRLWHGEKDRGVPLEMVKEMTYRLQGAVLKTYLKDGHISIIFHHLHDMVSDIERYKRESTHSLQQDK
jgi:pimeloyl-ACP methyl ester carboxylesterase